MGVLTSDGEKRGTAGSEGKQRRGGGGGGGGGGGVGGGGGGGLKEKERIHKPKIFVA